MESVAFFFGGITMTDLLHDISVGEKAPEIVNIIIETPQGTRNKYELDKETGLIKFDRYVHSPIAYPGDYGFVPRTHWPDGDPLDALVLTREALHPGVLVEGRVIGGFEMIDSGEVDDKLLCVPNDDKYFDNIHDLKDLAPFLLDEIKFFFERYKELKAPGKKLTEVKKFFGKEEAHKKVAEGQKLYKEKFGK